MPHFVFFGADGPDGPDIRARVREEHRAYLKVDQPGCRIVLAGPMLEDDNDGMNGTLLVFEAEDRAAVERFLAGDPYAKAGLFEWTEVRRWSWNTGRPGA